MLLAFEGVSQMIIGMEVLERTIVMFDGCLSFRRMRDRGLWWSLASLLVLGLFCRVFGCSKKMQEQQEGRWVYMQSPMVF